MAQHCMPHPSESWSSSPGALDAVTRRQTDAHPRITQEAIFREQPQLLKALLGLIQPPAPPTAAAAAAAAAPSVKPGRPTRALIARIVVLVLTRGDQKSLYDVAQSLLRGVNGSETKGAPEREKEWRIACTFVLGEVYAVFGSQVSRP